MLLITTFPVESTAKTVIPAGADVDVTATPEWISDQEFLLPIKVHSRDPLTSVVFTIPLDRGLQYAGLQSFPDDDRVHVVVEERDGKLWVAMAGLIAPAGDGTLLTLRFNTTAGAVSSIRFVNFQINDVDVINR